MYVGLVTHALSATVRHTATPVMCFVPETWLRMIDCQVHLAVRPTIAGRGEKALLDAGSSEHLLSISAAQRRRESCSGPALAARAAERDSGACPGTERLCCFMPRDDLAYATLCYRSLQLRAGHHPFPPRTLQQPAGALREPRSR